MNTNEVADSIKQLVQSGLPTTDNEIANQICKFVAMAVAMGIPSTKIVNTVQLIVAEVRAQTRTGVSGEEFYKAIGDA